MKDAVKELRKDFKELLGCLDFKRYDPYSKMFMRASFVGQMWFLVKQLCDDDEVEAELDGAKKYMERFMETGDTAFRDMAHDELKHAGILIKKGYEWADDDKKAILEQHENERQELLKKIGKDSA